MGHHRDSNPVIFQLLETVCKMLPLNQLLRCGIILNLRLIVRCLVRVSHGLGVR